MIVDSGKQKELIERMKQGERSAFDEMVEIYKMKGFSIAYNMVGNCEDARDILQEAFVKVYLNIKGFRENAQFSTWFYRIVVNCCLDFLRKRQRANRVFAEPLIDEEGQVRELEVADTTFDPARMAMAGEISRNLEFCIAALSERQRICFVLKHQNGLSIEEIAQAIKCNPATVKVHLFRAVSNLRKSLPRYIAQEGGNRC